MITEPSSTGRENRVLQRSTNGKVSCLAVGIWFDIRQRYLEYGSE